MRANPYVIIGGVKWFNPTAEKYALADDGPWLPIVDVKPVTDEKHYAVPVGWENESGKCVMKYEIREYVPPAKRWTPLAIKRALVTAEKWDEVKAMVETAGLYEDFVMAQVIADDDDAFKAGYAQAVSMYGKEAVDEILSQIPEAV